MASMTDEKVKECVQIAEELAKEICTGETSRSLLAARWKEDFPHLYENMRKKEHLLQEIAFHDSINVEEALEAAQKRIAPSARRFSIRTIGIAASFLLIVGAASFWLWNNDGEKAITEWTAAIPGSSKTSILSKDNKAVTLEDHRLAVKGNQLIGNTLDGKKTIAIELNPNNLFNRLSVPRGGEYELTLEDGTVVKVNTASELLFPTHFKKHVRQVYLNGEAYFKVKENKTNPFQVHLGKLNVQVTGTSFNIKAYEEDEELRITLVEGSINVREGQTTLASLVPGQLFTYRKAANEYSVSEANLSTATSWTAGKFIFYNETIDHIMRDLSRWYDVDITVSNDIKNLRYSGMLLRNQPLTEMLNAFSLTKELDFKIHRNKRIDAIEKENKE